MVQMIKTVKCSLEDIEIYDALLKEIGHIGIINICFCKYNQIIAVQAFCGDVYLGKTLLLRCVKVYYDKWGLPYYRFARYTGKTEKSSAYLEFKTKHLMGVNDV